ncbi:hypothetical protein [Rhizobium leguminosarum]|uniref:hypothetical protein n=1 Tax=Rhizobium leguminosarum TaxID=384 RepID=UPI001FE0010B|nr:hypothetical protein [Rhizobium leguminosarum]
MARLVYFKASAANPAALDAVDRQIVVRQIVDELQEICDGDAAGGGAADIRRSFVCFRRSALRCCRSPEPDDECWQRIVDELLQLRATMVDLKAGQGGRISH